MSSSFGKRFKYLRLRKELNQEELVKEFNTKYGYNFSVAAISMYENNKRMPEIEPLKCFADYFGVSIDYLLGRSNESDTVILMKSELPKELADIGYEYIEVFKNAKELGFSPEELKNLIEFMHQYKNKEKLT